MTELSLGISPCPNDVFIFAGLILGAVTDPDLGFRFDYQDVQTLNERAAGGVYDVVKISYAAYPSIARSYGLLECGGALGRGCGPLLLRYGAGRLSPSAPVLVPGERTTAHFLLDFYLEGAPVRKRFLPFDRLYEVLCAEPGSQGVVIHEKRFTYVRDGLTLVADLGEHWEARTGYPIPLGAIAARRGLDAERVSQRVRESLAWSRMHPAEALALCREYAAEMDDAVMRAHIDLYVNDFTYDLGEEGRAAVAYFLERLDKVSPAS